MTDTTAGEGVTLADQIRERASGYRRVYESAGLKLDCSTINGALEYGRAQGMEMAATYLDNLAAQPSAGSQGEAVGVDRDWMIKVIRERSLPQDAADMIIGAMRFAATPAQPDTGDVAALREAIARIIDPDAWHLWDTRPTFLPSSRLDSFAKADRILAALSKPNAPGAPEDGGA